MTNAAARPQARWRAAVEPLRHRQFRIWAAARWTSAAGSSVASIALAFAVLRVGGDAGDLGVVMAAGMATETVLPLLGGVVGDRWPRGRIQAAAFTVLGVVQAVCAAGLVAGVVRPVHLLAASVVTGAVFALTGPASAGVVPLTVPDGLRGRALALESTGIQALKTAGPAIGGLLIAAAGPEVVIAVDALSFLAAAAIVSRLRITAPPRPRTRPLDDFADGWAAFRRNRPIVLLTASGMVAVPLWLATFHTLGPTAGAQQLGGPAAWGLVFSCFTAGLTAGAGLCLVTGPYPPGWAVCMSALAMAGPPAALAVTAPLPVVATVACATGVLVNGAIVKNRTWLQQEYPPGMLGRITAISGTGQCLLVPGAYLAAGPTAAHAGFHPTLAAAAVLLAAAALLPLTAPTVRALRIHPPSPPTDTPAPAPALPRPAHPGHEPLTTEGGHR